MNRITMGVIALALALAAGSGVAAQERGAVTNLPIPRYVSLKASKGNVRRGPSLRHRSDWVFTRRARIDTLNCFPPPLQTYLAQYRLTDNFTRAGHLQIECIKRQSIILIQ